VERVMGGRAGASLLIAAVAVACGRGKFEKIEPVGKLDSGQRAKLPSVVPRVSALLREVRAERKAVPAPWLAEAVKQFPKSSHSLNAGELRELGAVALKVGNWAFGYAVSAAGLENSSGLEADFLLMRARSLRDRDDIRSVVCAAAAAQLARHARSMDTLNEAVEFSQSELGTDGPPLTVEQANDVLRREKEWPTFPKGKQPGPDYRDLAPCNCPSCRLERGEILDPFEADDDEDDDDIFPDDIMKTFPPPPPDMPHDIARMLLEEAEKAVNRGETFEEFLDRTMGRPPGGAKKKGKRRK
jgi:hypothetical protein